MAGRKKKNKKKKKKKKGWRKERKGEMEE